MILRVIPILFLFLFLSSCSSTIYVHKDPTVHSDRIFSYEQVNSRIRGDTASIKLINDSVYSASNVLIYADSTTFTNNNTNMQHRINTSDILSIKRIDHTSGAITGLGYGLLAGASLGLITSFARSNADRENSAWSVIIFSGAGSVAGICLGSLNGNVQEFKFQSDSSSASKKSLNK
ncbi:MAG: hypothetical protein ABSD46_12015 [Bacteroidota bacterium]